MKTFNFTFLILRLTITILYAIIVKDLNITLLFLLLEGVSFFLVQNRKEYLLLNLLLLIFIISSVSLDLYRDFSGGINKSGNELAFYDIISQLTKENFSFVNIIDFYIVYEDIFFISLNVFLYKFLHLKDFINIIILNNYLATWSILLIWRTFKISSLKSAIVSSIGILLFYASSGLRDILGLLLFSITFYLFKTKSGLFKYFIILIIIILQYFIRPFNSILSLSFIISIFFFEKYKIKNKNLILYFFSIIVISKILMNLQYLSFAEDLYSWNQSHNESILFKSDNSILANLRLSPYGFIIPLLITSFGENMLIFLKFSNFNLEYLILSITSVYTLFILILLFKYFFKKNGSNTKNALFIICSFHSVLIFFLTDETRHRLFFLILISFILLINFFNENNSSN